MTSTIPTKSNLIGGDGPGSSETPSLAKIPAMKTIASMMEKRGYFKQPTKPLAPKQSNNGNQLLSSHATSKSKPKPPLSPIRSSSKVSNDDSSGCDIVDDTENRDEFSKIDLHKPLFEQLSRSVKKPNVNREKVLDRQFITPQAKAKEKMTNNFKFDPNYVTGIPMIPTKKPTVPVPFTFAKDTFGSKRVTKRLIKEK